MVTLRLLTRAILKGIEAELRLHSSVKVVGAHRDRVVAFIDVLSANLGTTKNIDIALQINKNYEENLVTTICQANGTYLKHNKLLKIR